MSNVAVTVLMPVYNAGTHLREAIDSILNQTFRDFASTVWHLIPHGCAR
jgi:glycosyltransferase involved in cell wall biosynthesis